MPMPGLAERLKSDGAIPSVQPEPIAAEHPAPTVESLQAEVEELRESLAEVGKQVDYWRGKFKACDAHNGELQTKVANDAGLIAALGRLPA